MKTRYLIAGMLAMAATTSHAQNVISVGKGSYAEYAPLSVSKTTTHGGDQSRFMQYRKLNIHEREGQPLPTNDWWTNMINGNDHTTGQDITGHLWSYPLYVQATRSGIDVKYPTFWIDNGTEMKANSKVVVGGVAFNPGNGGATAQWWHDWDVAFSLEQGNKLMYTTMAHGMPFTWIEMRNIRPTVKIVRDNDAQYSNENMTAVLLRQDGTPLGNGDVTDGFIVGMTDATDGMTPEYYGIFLPENTTVNIDGGVATLTFHGAQQYVVVGTLPSIADYDSFAQYAYSVPRKTEVSWQYDQAAGKVRTYWDIEAENLRNGASIPAFGDDDNSPAVDDEPSSPDDDGTTTVPVGDDGYTGVAHSPRKAASDVKVLQGFMPHHYRDYSGSAQLPGTELYSYQTPHGKLKMVEGTHFEIDYDFFGMLPYYPVPNANNDDAHPYNESMMIEMLQRYANTGTFGDDTYWGGKGLTQMALNMMFAREMGQKELFKECHDKLKDAFVNWLTFTPGESNHFFARDPRFGGMIGYSTSYDSDTYNDHHFHYGYFTLAGALLALVDDDFRDNYGEMLTLLAKDYANWDRNDKRFPLFRTFDPWAGHSFAGGMGDGNGNGQESTSEAMQGWGGVYLLGVALNNKEMRDAGLFGWVTEARGTAEYWFDRHKDPNTGNNTYHTKGNNDYSKGYNIDYDKFSAGYTENDEWKYMTPPYNSNLTCHGVGWWTYFGFDAVFMQGIQWMPISPALDYLSEDTKFAAWDMKRLMEDTFHNGFLDNNGTTLAASDWGNVALSYYQRSNPKEVARIFDEGWNAGYDTYKTSSTNGITYFVTHSHLTNGDLDWTIKADIPTARVYVKDGNKTYTAFNPTDNAITVTFSDGYKLAVPARRLAVSGQTSKDNTDIFTADDTQTDPREEIIMENLALGKDATASSNENAAAMPASSITDGKDNTRWASTKNDGQYVTVDLGKNATIYKVNIFWEAAFAAKYDIQLSTNGTTWTTAATTSGAYNAQVETKLGDKTARYIRIMCRERSNPAYGISIYELQAFGKWNDASANDLLGVKITSEQETLKQYNPTKLNIKGYTVGGNWVDVTPAWSSKDGSITSNGTFTPRVSTSATATATVGTLIASKTFPVEEALYTAYLTLSPNKAQTAVGDPLKFTVEVKNQFAEPMKANLDNVEWRVCTYTTREETYMDGNTEKTRTVYDLTDSNNGTIDKATATATFTQTGDYAIVATNGEASDMAFVSVKAYADINLALNKPVTVSSGSNAEKAVDGTIGNNSRWESEWKVDPQTLTVDLQAVYNINKVNVTWEAAGAKEYTVEYSTDGINWNQIASVTNGAAGQRSFNDFSVQAQYVRVKGTKRLMEAYGYSIEELEVYGTSKVGEPSATLRDKGLNTETMAHELTGIWNDNDFAALDNASNVAYDLTDVTMSEGTSFDAANPNAMIIVTAEKANLVTNSKNIIVKDGSTYTSKNIEYTDNKRVNNKLTIDANDVKYERPMKSTYATLSLPYDCELPAGTKAFSLSQITSDASETVIRFEEATSIEAGKPYIIKAASATEQMKAQNTTVAFNEETISRDGVEFSANLGYQHNIPSENNVYTLKANDDLRLYHMVNGTIPEFRAYFILSEEATAKPMRVVLEGEPEHPEVNGISNVVAEQLTGIFNVYSIDGKKVKSSDSPLISLPKGIYIINGKKVIVK